MLDDSPLEVAQEFRRSVEQRLERLKAHATVADLSTALADACDLIEELITAEAYRHKAYVAKASVAKWRKLYSEE